MVTKRTYTCNLCKDPVAEGTGIGIVFHSFRVQFTVPFDAENHMCQRCLDWIEIEQEESRRVAKARADAAAA